MDVHGLLRLSQVPGVGNARLRALISHFKSPQAVFNASARELIAVPGIEEKTARNILHFRDGSRYADDELRRLRQCDGRIVTLWDHEYPENLRRIYDPPTHLYVLGSLKDIDKYSIAVVGTRNPTAYGKMVAERFSAELSALGLTVVSGLARGIDTVAHAAALDRRTVAVIGSGLDVIYPPENKNLAEQITRNGAVVSEFEMGAQPDAEHFPRRNRIISGLTLGTLVVETNVDGGAMLTARWALDQNREVFAIPGPVTDKRNIGSNTLIKRGEAELVRGTEDILEQLSSKLRPLLRERDAYETKTEPQLTLFEKKIHDVLEEEPMHIDAIASRAAISVSDSLVQLLSLEFKGLVRQLPGKMFVRM